MDCWSEVEKLEGHTIQTLDQGNKIDIVRVGPDSVVVRSHATQNDREISRKVIERFWSQLTRRGELARTEIRDAYEGRASSAIAAILAAMPGVRHTTRPIRLLFER